MNTTTGTIKQLEFWGEGVMGKTLIVLLYGRTRDEEDEFANELELGLMEQGLKENYFVQATQRELRYTIENSFVPPDCIIVKDNRKRYDETFLKLLEKDCNVVSVLVPTTLEFDYGLSAPRAVAKSIMEGG